MLALVIPRGGADADAGVVHEDVEPPEALAVALDDGGDALLVREVGRNVLDLEPAITQGCHGTFEAFGLARGEREPEALFAQSFGDGEPDAP